jgi:hypothetical protein
MRIAQQRDRGGDDDRSEGHEFYAEFAPRFVAKVFTADIAKRRQSGPRATAVEIRHGGNVVVGFNERETRRALALLNAQIFSLQGWFHIFYFLRCDAMNIAGGFKNFFWLSQPIAMRVPSSEEELQSTR